MQMLTHTQLTTHFTEQCSPSPDIYSCTFTYTPYRGGYRVFQKGGLRPAIRNAGGGGGGCCPFKARYEKREGGGGGCAVHLRPDTKSVGGPALQARYKKRGRGRGCLAEEGALPYMKGGVATPKTPPLDPPLPYHLYRSTCLHVRCVHNTCM